MAKDFPELGEHLNSEEYKIAITVSAKMIILGINHTELATLSSVDLENVRLIQAGVKTDEQSINNVLKALDLKRDDVSK